MNIIATVDKGWGIGKGGNSLVSIPNEKKLLREETMGKVIVMGRKTFEKLNGGQALYGRINIVFSKNENFKPKNVVIVSNFEECLAYFSSNNIKKEDIFVLGGKSIYELFLPYCKQAHITFVDFLYEADEFIENLNEHKDWKLILETEEETYFNLSYNFKLYQNTRK